jgi:hypothetical protein
MLMVGTAIPVALDAGIGRLPISMIRQKLIEQGELPDPQNSPEVNPRAVFDPAHIKEVEQRPAREPAAIDLEGIGVEGEPVQPAEFLHVGVDREIDPVLVDRALLCAPRRVTEDLSDIGDGKI